MYGVSDSKSRELVRVVCMELDQQSIARILYSPWWHVLASAFFSAESENTITKDSYMYFNFWNDNSYFSAKPYCWSHHCLPSAPYVWSTKKHFQPVEVTCGVLLYLEILHCQCYSWSNRSLKYENFDTTEFLKLYKLPYQYRCQYLRIS